MRLNLGEYFVKNPKTLWLAGKGRVIDEKGEEISKWVTAYKNFLLHLNSYNLLLIVNYLMQPSVFLSKKAYDKYGPFTGTSKYVMEYDLWLKIGKEKMPAIIPKNLSYFRLHPGAFSLSSFIDILKHDSEIVKSHTSNKFFIFLHSLNNVGRKAVLKLRR